MSRIHLQIVTLLCLLINTPAVYAEIVIVANLKNSTEALSARQLLDIYMGRYQSFPNGEPAFPLDLLPDSPLRVDFYQKLTNKSVAEVNAYWARLLFTGRATPPRVMSDSLTVLKAVRENLGAIGYIDSTHIDGTVKVIARVD